MLKKLSLLGLSLMLAFYPTVALAAENDEEPDSEQEEKAKEAGTNESTDEEEASEAEDEPADEDEDADEEDNDTVEQESENKDEDNQTSSEEDKENNEDKNADDETSNKESNDQEYGESEKADDDQVEEEATTEENEEEDNEEEIQTQALNDDECRLGTNTNGNVTGEAVWNADKGYYELPLEITVINCYNTDDDEGYVGFDLPEGVDLVEGAAPEGVMVKDNKLYIPYPNVKAHDELTTNAVIPVEGEVSGNGQVSKAGRSIYDQNNDYFIWTDNLDSASVDFSNVQGKQGDNDEEEEIELPVAEAIEDLSGTINGKVTGLTKGDDNYSYYNLELNVELTNNGDSNISDLSDVYTSFTVPEGLTVLENDENIEGLNLDGNNQDIEAVVVKLQEDDMIKSGDTITRTVTVPIIGKVTGELPNSDIELYRYNGLGYEMVGPIQGNAKVDFSEMTEQWEFDATAMIIKDFPNLDDNQFGLAFTFSTQNLTIDNIDKVKVEFKVPSDITVHEPDEYTQDGSIPDYLKDSDFPGNNLDESLNIEWNGNTAIIDLDTVNDKSGYEGFFTAFGESSKALNDLKGIEVLVTLYQNGNEVAKEINVPFEIVSHEGGETEEPEEPKDPEKPGDPGDNSNDDGKGEGGEGNSNKDEDDGKDDTNKNDGNNGNKENNDDTNNNKDDSNVNVSPKNDGSDDNDDDSATISGTNDSDSDGSGWALPDTATNMFNLLLIGSTLIVAGGALILFRKRKLAQE